MDERRAKILKSASKLFRHYSYEKTTVEEIASDAGLSKGAIYLEFKNKEDLLLAVIEDFSMEECTQIALKFNELGQDGPVLPAVRDILVAHLLNVYERVQQQQHSPESMVYTNHRVRQEMTIYFTTIVDLLAGAFRRATSSGELPALADYEQTARTIFSSLNGYFPPYDCPTITPGSEPITGPVLAARAKDLLTLLLNGLKQA